MNNTNSFLYFFSLNLWKINITHALSSVQHQWVNWRSVADCPLHLISIFPMFHYNNSDSSVGFCRQTPALADSSAGFVVIIISSLNHIVDSVTWTMSTISELDWEGEERTALRTTYILIWFRKRRNNIDSHVDVMVRISYLYVRIGYLYEN